MSRRKWSRISGVRTANAVRSSSSTALRPNSTNSGKKGAPPVIELGRHSRANSRNRFIAFAFA
jgi:hypothetical protein